MSDDTYEAPRFGWCCFHCGDRFANSDAGIAAAREHFGPTPDWLPECIERRTTATEDLVRRTRKAESDALHFRVQREAAEENADACNIELASVRTLFHGARSVSEAHALFHSVEGRAIAAEAVLADLWKRVPSEVHAAHVAVCGPAEYYPASSPTHIGRAS